jgi:DNA-binding transcriptional LysR family regulator
MVARLETFSGSLADIRAFCTVVDFGTMSAAAKELVETKGSVSRRIARLEASIGIKLLARSPRAVSILDEGFEFYEKASAALALLDEARETVRTSQDVLRGSIRVTASHDVAAEILPGLIARFRKKHPQINFEVIASDSTLDLTTNRIDLALRVKVGDLADSPYQAALLADVNIGLFASPTYLKGQRRVEMPSDLASQELILSRERPGPSHILLTRGQEEVRLALRPSIRASDFACVVRLAVAGAGIAFMPTMLAGEWIARRELVQLLPEWGFRGPKLYALTAARRQMPARVREFRNFLALTLRPFRSGST